MPDNITYTDPFSNAPNVGISQSTMNRWLKLANTQVVTKIFDYIPIYAITVASPGWAGSSLRVVQWNFQIQNSFTLTPTQLLQLQLLNCLVCIRFNDNNSNVTRYKLNNNVGEALYAPNYTGQLIPPNFSIEVWSTVNTGANVVIPVEIDLNTSLYNTTQDSFDPTNNTVISSQKLADAVATVEVFGDTSGYGAGAFNLPFTFPANSAGNNNSVPQINYT